MVAVIRAVLLATFLSALGSCTFENVFRRQRTLLRVTCDPPAARVYLNDRYLGSARRLTEHPGEAQVGPNYVTVRAPGYFPHDLRVDLPPGETHINLRLRAIPP